MTTTPDTEQTSFARARQDDISEDDISEPLRGLLPSLMAWEMESYAADVRMSALGVTGADRIRRVRADSAIAADSIERQLALMPSVDVLLDLLHDSTRRYESYAIDRLRRQVLEACHRDAILYCLGWDEASVDAMFTFAS